MGSKRVLLQRSRAARPAQCEPAHSACPILHHTSPFPDALRKLDQILEIAPGDVDASVEEAAIAQAEGGLLARVGDSSTRSIRQPATRPLGKRWLIRPFSSAVPPKLSRA